MTPDTYSRSRRLDSAAVVALAVFATLVAWALREWVGYPLNPSDERNWVVVAAEVAKGVKWPVSGALHFAATRALADAGGLSHAQALAALGVFSVPLVLLAYGIAYRLMGFAHALPALLLLSTSTYFWAPLLESRPQQWGQALVMLCAVIAWRNLSGPDTGSPGRQMVGWLGWGLLFLLTCGIHLLSGPIAFGISGLLAIGHFALYPRHWPRVLLWGLASLPGLLVLVWPTGPYATMLEGLGRNYLTSPTSRLWLLVYLGLVSAFALALAMRTVGPKLARWCLRSIERRPAQWTVFLGLGIFAFLALQALMLPKDAWVLYRGSVAIFMVKQAGNLFFLGALLAGTLHIATRPDLHHAPPWAGQIAMLACMAVLAVGALALSTLAQDTNWMLRLINYTLPFAAPLAVLGLAQWRRATPFKWALLLMASLISLGTAGSASFLA